MTDVKGRAAFHKHTDGPRHPGAKATAGTSAERRALLKESMRHLDPRDVARHAKKNSSIVPSDSHLNTAFVNDGLGGFTVATKVQEVLAYGKAREGRVRRKITEGTRTVDLFVVFLPRTLCVEIENYYPKRNPDGSERLDPVTGEPMSRSRWVARDRDEAMRYFRDAVAYIGGEVSPGGLDSVHGWATNFDESTPHIQLMADPFGPDPKAPATMPDALRTMASQAYTSHRDVRKANGKRYGLGERIREYQDKMREHMVGLGWPVERDPGPRRGKGQTKTEFQETQDEKADAAALRSAGHEAIIQAAEFADATEAEARAKEDALAAEVAAEQAAILDGLQKVESGRDMNLSNAAKLTTAKERLDAVAADLDDRETSVKSGEKELLDGHDEIKRGRKRVEDDAKALTTERGQLETRKLAAIEEVRGAQSTARRVIEEAEAEAARVVDEARERAAAISSEDVLESVRNGSADLWVKFLDGQPQVKQVFEEWAFKKYRVRDIENLDPKTLGAPHAQRRAALRADASTRLGARGEASPTAGPRGAGPSR